MHHVAVRRGSLVVALAVLVAAVAATQGVGAASAASAPENDTDAPHHADPARVEGDGDLDRVERWLGQRLTERLREQSVQLSEGQYETAEGMLSDEFQAQLAKYVDVAGDVDGGMSDQAGSDRPGSAYERVQSDQREIVTAVQEYESTYESYEAARDRGDGQAAQQQARRLQRLAREIDGNTNNVSGDLRSIEAATEVDTGDVRQRLQNVSENISQRQSRVRQESFVETDLQANADASGAAFNRSVTIDGLLQTARGEPIADKLIDLRIGERSYEVQTDGEGRFSVTYRPVAISADAQAVNVTYRPADNTPYLAASASVPLTIDQVTPTLRLSVSPSQGGLGTNVQVTTIASVEGEVVPDLPIRVTASNTTLGTGVTNEGGVGVVNWSVPATVAPGEYGVGASIPLENAAIGQAQDTGTFVVEQTETDLSLSVTQEGDAVQINGQLSLQPDGSTAQIPAELPVEISLVQQTETVQLEDDGSFSLRVPRSAIGNVDSVTVQAVFEGTDTNLGRASAEESISFGSSGSENSGLDIDTLAAIAGVALLVGLAAAFVIRRRRRRTAAAAVTETTPDTPVPPDSVDQPPEAVHERAVGEGVERTDEQWLAGARTAMADGDIERAVASAYAAAHGHVTDNLGLEGILTPRELLSAAEGEIEPEAHEALTTLTDVYERVIFASDPSEDAGELAIYAAATVLETDDDISPLDDIED